jgi:hypothetical protein
MPEKTEGAIPRQEIVTKFFTKTLQLRYSPPEISTSQDIGVGMDHEVIQLVSIFGPRRRNRWYGPGVSVCLARLELGVVRRRHLVNWDRFLGVAMVLVVVTLSWTAVGFAVSHWVR